MRIKVTSDHHHEFRNMEQTNTLLQKVLAGEWDVIILAGDIANKWLTIPLLEMIDGWCEDNDRQAIYVRGNHEFYGRQSLKYPIFSRQDATTYVGEYLTELNRDVCEIDGVRFAGCVGWPRARFDNNENEKALNDYRVAEANKDREFIADIVNNHRADVIITHFLPHVKSIAEKYWTEDNTGFHTPYDVFVIETSASLWVHGHTHSVADYTVNGTRVVCYPVGYPGEFAPRMVQSYGKIIHLVGKE